MGNANARFDTLIPKECIALLTLKETLFETDHFNFDIWNLKVRYS